MKKDRKLQESVTNSLFRKKKKRTIVGFAMKNYYYHLHIKSIKDHGNNKSLYYHSQKSSESDVVSSRPPLTPLLWTSEYLLFFFIQLGAHQDIRVLCDGLQCCDVSLKDI